MKPAFAGDTLLLRNKTFEMVDQPLEVYFELIGSRPAFEPVSTEGRGYSARWLIEDGWLYLASMDARWSDEEALQLNHLFPFAGNKVFAAWFSGPVRAYRRDRPLPDLSAPDKLRYPDVTLQIENGRIANLVRDTAHSAEFVPPAQHDLSALDEADLARSRRATIHAGWDKVML
ncbi:MAG: hypothetical protein WA888_06840 [Burkholderiaceae bacterium]